MTGAIEPYLQLCDFSRARTLESGASCFPSITRPAQTGRRGRPPRKKEPKVRYRKYAAALAAMLLVTDAAAESPDEPGTASLCPAMEFVPLPPLAEPGLEPGSLQLSADYGALEKDGPSNFRGDVEIIRDDRALVAERVLYTDSEGGMVNFSGSARYWDSSLFWEGDNGKVVFDRNFGRLSEGRFQLRGQRGRGWADVIVQDNEKDVTRLNGVTYTTCPGEVPAWRFQASSIKLDHDRNWGRAKHVRLRVKDVPVLYLPYISFPLSNERKTGFLPPTVGRNVRSGMDIQTPFYWNIAPEYDATITPRLLSQRGLMLGGQFRYLLDDGFGEVNSEILPSDSESDNDFRGLLTVSHFQQFRNRRGLLVVDFNQVSDRDYFEDFGNSLSATSTRFLDRRVDLRYRAANWLIQSRVQDFQSVDPSLASRRPYARLPQVRLLSLYQPRNFGFNGQIDVEGVYFQREQDTSGYRLDLRPNLTFPMRARGFTVLPMLQLRHTEYILDRAGPGEDHVSRTVPVATLDGTMFLERQFSFAGEGFLQTLEPRIYYAYIPEVEQGDAPIFDSGRFDFTFQQMFRADRFSGRDRIGDTNQLTLSVSSRILETGTGFERLRLGMGQVLYFSDRELQLNGIPQTTDFSEFIGEISANITRQVQVSGTLQWDPELQRTEKGALRLRYRPDNGALLNMDYRLRRSTQLVNQAADVEQTDISFSWPLTPQWSTFGRWNYSMVDSRTLEVVGGVEYNSCCWGVRAAARRFLSTAEGRFDTGIFMQIELKGLAGFGRQTSTFLMRNIPGYEQDF
jgi:LPS-assembly protein